MGGRPFPPPFCDLAAFCWFSAKATGFLEDRGLGLILCTSLQVPCSSHWWRLSFLGGCVFVWGGGADRTMSVS